MKAAAHGAQPSTHRNRHCSNRPSSGAKTHVTSKPQSSKMVMVPFLRLDSTGEVASHGGPVQPVDQQRKNNFQGVSMNRPRSKRKSVPNHLFGNFIRFAPTSSKHLTAPHISRVSALDELLDSRQAPSLVSVGQAGMGSHVKTAQPTMPRTNRYGLWGMCPAYPILPQGVFPCHVFTALQSQKHVWSLQTSGHIVSGTGQSVLDKAVRWTHARSQNHSSHDHNCQSANKASVSDFFDAVGETLQSTFQPTVQDLITVKHTFDREHHKRMNDMAGHENWTKKERERDTPPQAISEKNTGVDRTACKENDRSNTHVNCQSSIVPEREQGSPGLDSQFDVNWDEIDSDEEDTGDENQDEAVHSCLEFKGFTVTSFFSAPTLSRNQPGDDEDVDSVEDNTKKRSIPKPCPEATKRWNQHYSTTTCHERSPSKVHFSCGLDVDQVLEYEKGEGETLTTMEIQKERDLSRCNRGKAAKLLREKFDDDDAEDRDSADAWQEEPNHHVDGRFGASVLVLKFRSDSDRTEDQERGDGKNSAETGGSHASGLERASVGEENDLVTDGPDEADDTANFDDEFHVVFEHDSTQDEGYVEVNPERNMPVLVDSEDSDSDGDDQDEASEAEDDDDDDIVFDSGAGCDDDIVLQLEESDISQSEDSDSSDDEGESEAEEDHIIFEREDDSAGPNPDNNTGQLQRCPVVEDSDSGGEEFSDDDDDE